MITIQTKPDCTLGFIPIKDDWDRFVKDGLSIEYSFDIGHERDLGTRFIEVGREFEIIGKLSEITEEQAMELVYETKTWFGDVTINSLDGLYQWSLNAGIKEKDFGNYLVIKL